MSIARAIARRPTKLRIPVTGGTIVERHGVFQLRASVRVGDRSHRIRQTLHVPAVRQNTEAARIEAEKRLAEARLLLGGITRLSFAENAARYLQRAEGEELGWTDVAIIKELTAHFGTRRLSDIPGAEIVSYVDERQRTNAASTRERYVSTVVALLNSAITRGQYPRMPDFQRDQKARNPSTRQRRAVEEVTQEVVSALKRCMHLTTLTQTSVEITTGARVRSVLHGCALRDLNLADMILTFRDTKGGFDVPAALPEALRPLLTDYLAWRDQQVRAGRVGPGSEQPLFLTPRGCPYKDNRSRWGTQNKTAFNGAKRRAAKLLDREYDTAITAASAAGNEAEVARLRRRRADDLRVVRALTQHWFRHRLATELGRQDLRAAMMQGGWRDIRTVQGYLMHDPEYQRALVEQRGVGDTNLAREGSNDDPK